MFGQRYNVVHSDQDFLVWSIFGGFTIWDINLVSCCPEADLRIGELQWGDSGVYFCKIVIADDLEGKNEAQLELLVLGMFLF